ncbi:hypothetical protein PR1_31 [Providencia phage vB_PreS_PR1]|uniref:Uncharacterized protein n=1 Tax=Providencia phage vB_PreS_PR1 TaxID=1931407 RepID=A0A1S6KV75_9CAUD|nr:hypothetical protein FDH30_gp032 [Providencia phage vB_PreS_PR1]AQT25319.1 hypothetical protein PR1_31 [Providencia phage vB_PreS_PR1]
MDSIVLVPHKIYAKEFEGRPGVYNLFVESVRLPFDSVTPTMWLMKQFKENLPFSFHQSKEIEEANVKLEMSVPLSAKSVEAVMGSFKEIDNIPETVH